MKYRQIRTKLLAAFLGVLLPALLVSSLLAGSGMARLRALAVQGGESIGTRAAASSEAALTGQALSDIMDLAEAKAHSIYLQLDGIAKSLAVICACIGQLYQHPEQFLERPFLSADAQPSGTPVMQWLLPAGMRIQDPAVRRETYLQGNLESLYAAVMQSNPSICSIYYTSATGINTGYDAYSGSKPAVLEGRTLPWYLRARDSGGLVVSDAYEDTFGRGLCVSMSMPCYGANGAFAGVASLDILIGDLNREIVQTAVGENGFAVLFSHDGSVISAPGTPPSQLLGSRADEILAGMASGGSAALDTNIGGQDAYAFCAPIALSGWTVAIVLPKADIIAPALHAKAEIASLSAATTSGINQEIKRAIFRLSLLLLIVTAAAAAIVLNLSNSLSKPIRQLSAAVETLDGGNLDWGLQIDTGDEIERLSEAFGGMTAKLRGYLADLTRVTADKERIATELSVAAQIQSDMLPCIFPAFPECPAFDIYASMHAAREVGGDFYDFFLVGERHLAVIIADVSGKGVPAALFMVIAKTLLKNYAQLGLPPDRIFETANKQLCENNDAGMFVTAFLGLLDLGSGTFSYVNAGHNPPLLSRRGQPFQWLDMPPGFVLAGLEGTPFIQKETVLEPGDRLFLYTDGVTEAMDGGQALYSESRLQAALNSGEADGAGVQGLVQLVWEDVSAFAQGVEQADDITMLALEIKGKESANGTDYS